MTTLAPAKPLRLALDQNFPRPLLDALQPFLPADLELAHIFAIDSRMSDLGDRELIVQLAAWGWDGLITNNYRMLNIPEEIAAVVSTRTVLIAIEKLGHDPIRAAGAVLLELTGLRRRIVTERGNVFRLRYQQRPADDPWTYLQKIAGRRRLTVAELWDQVRITDAEIVGALGVH